MDQYEDLKNFTEKTQLKSLRFVDFTKQNREVNHGQWSIVSQLATKPQHLDEPHLSVTPAEKGTAQLNAFQQNAIPRTSATPATVPASSALQNALHAPNEQPRSIFTAAGKESRSPLFQEMSQNAPLGQAMPGVQCAAPAKKSRFEMPPQATEAPCAETMTVPEPVTSPFHNQMVTKAHLSSAPDSETRSNLSPLFSRLQHSNVPVPASDEAKRSHREDPTSRPAVAPSLLFSTTPNAKSGLDTQTKAAVNAGVFSHLFVHQDNDISHQGKETLLQPLLKRIATCR